MPRLQSPTRQRGLLLALPGAVNGTAPTGPAEASPMETLTAAPELLSETSGGVVRLTLNRPDKRNALSRELLSRLREAQEAIASDPAARVVVLAARGPAFCAGHDLGEMVGCSESDYRDLFTLCSDVMQRFRRLPQPVVARVH